MSHNFDRWYVHKRNFMNWFTMLNLNVGWRLKASSTPELFQNNFKICLNFQSSKQNLTSVVYIRYLRTLLECTLPKHRPGRAAELLRVSGRWSLIFGNQNFKVSAFKVLRYIKWKIEATFPGLFFKMSKLSDLIPFLNFSFYSFLIMKFISMSFSTLVFDKFSIRQLNTFLVLSSK